MSNPTPENIRFHAAGHLAASVLLINAGFPGAAEVVLGDVQKYVNHPTVIAPQQLKDKMAEAVKSQKVADIQLLEKWFVDPLNTQIENG